MVFSIDISTHQDLDLLDSKESADLHCDFLTDISDIYYYLVSFEANNPHVMSFDRYTYSKFCITLDDSDPLLFDTIVDDIDNILNVKDVCFSDVEIYEEV